MVKLYTVQAVARISWTGVIWVSEKYVYMHKHVWRGGPGGICSPSKLFETRSSSEDRTRAVVLAIHSLQNKCILIYCTFPYVSERWYDSRLFSCDAVCGDSLEGKLVNPRAPEIVIILRMYLRMSFQYKVLLHTFSISSSGFLWTSGEHSCNQICLDSGDVQWKQS